MRHRTTTAAIAAALLLAGLTGCGQSYEETTTQCAKALAARPDSDKGKPKACDDVKAKDYDTLHLGDTLERTGLVDKDGNVDPDKLFPDDDDELFDDAGN